MLMLLTRDYARLAETVGDLGPTYIKFGQALASRSDIVGRDMAAALAALQDDLPPFPDAKAMAIVEEELPEAAAALQGPPVAAASLCQVYRGRLRGRDVAIKVSSPLRRQGSRRDVCLTVLIPLAALAADSLFSGEKGGGDGVEEEEHGGREKGAGREDWEARTPACLTAEQCISLMHFLCRPAAWEMHVAASPFPPVDVNGAGIPQVQRPGIRLQVAADAVFLRFVASALERSGVVKAKAVAAVDEFVARIFEEMDFENEAANLRRFASLYCRGGTAARTLPPPGVRVPELIGNLVGWSCPSRWTLEGCRGGGRRGGGIGLCIPSLPRPNFCPEFPSPLQSLAASAVSPHSCSHPARCQPEFWSWSGLRERSSQRILSSLVRTFRWLSLASAALSASSSRRV